MVADFRNSPNLSFSTKSFFNSRDNVKREIASITVVTTRTCSKSTITTLEKKGKFVQSSLKNGILLPF